MIILETVYYIAVIAGVLCGATYKLGYGDGKMMQKNNRPGQGCGYLNEIITKSG